MAAFSIAWDCLKADEVEPKPNLFELQAEADERVPKPQPSAEEMKEAVGELINPKTGMLKPSLIGVRGKGESTQVQAPSATASQTRSVLMPQSPAPPSKSGKPALMSRKPTQGKLETMALPPEWKNRLAIVGSRMFSTQPGLEDDHWELFDDKIQEWMDEHGVPDAIVSGGAEGADQMAAQWANDNKIPLIEHKPDYKTHGKWDATGMRNQDIVDDATHVLAFPSAHPDAGAGTQDTMLRAIQAEKPLHSHTIEHPSENPLKSHDYTPTGQADWFKDYMQQESPGAFASIPGSREKGEQFTDEEIDEMRAASEEEGGAQRGFEHAVRRMHGKRHEGGKMTTSGAKNPETGVAVRGQRMEGMPMHLPLTRRATRHLPRITDEQRMQMEIERMIEQGDVHPGMVEALRSGFRTEEQKAKEKETQKLMDEDARNREKRPQRVKAKPRRGKPQQLRNIRASPTKKKPDLTGLLDEDPDDELFETGEPMDIAFRMLKVLI